MRNLEGRLALQGQPCVRASELLVTRDSLAMGGLALGATGCNPSSGPIVLSAPPMRRTSDEILSGGKIGPCTLGRRFS